MLLSLFAPDMPPGRDRPHSLSTQRHRENGPHVLLPERHASFGTLPEHERALISIRMVLRRNFTAMQVSKELKGNAEISLLAEALL